MITDMWTERQTDGHVGAIMGFYLHTCKYARRISTFIKFGDDGVVVYGVALTIYFSVSQSLLVDDPIPSKFVDFFQF